MYFEGVAGGVFEQPDAASRQRASRPEDRRIGARGEGVFTAVPFPVSAFGDYQRKGKNRKIFPLTFAGFSPSDIEESTD